MLMVEPEPGRVPRGLKMMGVRGQRIRPHRETCIDRRPHVRMVEGEGAVVFGNPRSRVQVVMCPGFSGASALAKPMIDLVVDAGFGGIGIDLPRHWGAPGGDLSEHAINARRLRLIRKRLDPEAHLLLIGSSAASATTHDLAIQLGDRVLANVVVNGIGAYPLGWRAVNGFLRQSRVPMPETPLTRADVARSLTFFVSDPVAAMTMARYSATVDTSAAMKAAGELRLPSLLIGCLNDTLSPPEMTHAIGELIDPVAALMVREGGHAFCTLEGSLAVRATWELFGAAHRLVYDMGVGGAPIADRRQAWIDVSIQERFDHMTGHPYAGWKRQYALDAAGPATPSSLEPLSVLSLRALTGRRPICS